MERFDETLLRSIFKLVWTRFFITISQVFIGFYLTGSWSTGVSLTLQTLTLNAIFYIGHERAWNLSSYGRVSYIPTVFSDTWTRTIFKMVTWRIMVSANNFLVPYVLTGSAQIAFMAMSLSSIVNTGIHIGVERWFNTMRWGRRIVVDKPLY